MLTGNRPTPLTTTVTSKWASAAGWRHRGGAKN